MTEKYANVLVNRVYLLTSNAFDSLVPRFNRFPGGSLPHRETCLLIFFSEMGDLSIHLFDCDLTYLVTRTPPSALGALLAAGSFAACALLPAGAIWRITSFQVERGWFLARRELDEVLDLRCHDRLHSVEQEGAAKHPIIEDVGVLLGTLVRIAPQVEH